MREVRYRLEQPPTDPWLWAPWFRRVPDARLHGTRFRMEDDVAHAWYVALAPAEDIPALVEDVLSMPTPNATTWRLAEARGDVAVFEAAWREPMYPGVLSPMAVTQRVLGPEAMCSWLITRNAVVHRVLLPDPDLPHELWPHLRDEMTRYSGFAAVGVTMELERLREISLRSRDPRVVQAGIACFEMGALDDPPTATVEEAARAFNIGRDVAALGARALDRSADASAN